MLDKQAKVDGVVPVNFSGKKEKWVQIIYSSPRSKTFLGYIMFWEDVFIHEDLFCRMFEVMVISNFLKDFLNFWKM